MIGGVSEAVLQRKELSKKTKLNVMNATMLPTLVYGCEVWHLYIEVTRVDSPSHTDEGIEKNWKSKQSRQGEKRGYKVEAGPGT